MESIKQSKQKRGLKRNTIDKYYTKSSIVDMCIELIKKYPCQSLNQLTAEEKIITEKYIEELSYITNLVSV